ncbi:hypothetical protein [Larkinella arboricola]
MMKYLLQFGHYLKGKSDALGTSKNLLREVVVSVLTAVGTYLAIHFLMPPEPDVVGDLKEVIQTTVSNQARADSLEAWIRVNQKQGAIDSLQYKIRLYEERDSLRANGELSPLEAMRTIIGAINSKSKK